VAVVVVVVHMILVLLAVVQWVLAQSAAAWNVMFADSSLIFVFVESVYPIGLALVLEHFV
jgi:hypothetical protein